MAKTYLTRPITQHNPATYIIAGLTTALYIYLALLSIAPYIEPATTNSLSIQVAILALVFARQGLYLSFLSIYRPSIQIDISSFTIASPRLTTASRLNLFSLLVKQTSSYLQGINATPQVFAQIRQTSYTFFNTLQLFSVLLLYAIRYISSIKLPTQIGSFSFAYPSINSALKKRKSTREIGEPYRIPVSAASTSLVFQSSVIKLILLYLLGSFPSILLLISVPPLTGGYRVTVGRRPY